MNQPPYGPPGMQPQPHYGAPVPMAYAPPQQTPAPKEKGFFGGLFDLSFTTFVTTRVIKVLYVLFLAGLVIGLILGVIGGLITIIGGISADAGAVIAMGVVQMVVTPIGCIIALIYGRIMFECIAVFFRVAEHLAEINRKTKE
jgi:hypothetical protein